MSVCFVITCSKTLPCVGHSLHDKPALPKVGAGHPHSQPSQPLSSNYKICCRETSIRKSAESGAEAVPHSLMREATGQLAIGGSKGRIWAPRSVSRVVPLPMRGLCRSHPQCGQVLSLVMSPPSLASGPAGDFLSYLTF